MMLSHANVSRAQSQSFSRSYGSVLPTSLAYIVPLARGCLQWRPDAVMSTIGRGRYSVLRIFKGRRGRTGPLFGLGKMPFPIVATTTKICTRDCSTQGYP